MSHTLGAYEIVLDELRDYSYFKDDLIHPNDEAIGIVYEKFKVFGRI
ncbi:GSCFA domain-containing protein [Crocinitomix catalasitica]|nr:GSCFA domain-containing protein [Crocinitomix catalasitica]